MYQSTIITFLAGWALWFLLDKHPAALGIMLPEAQDDMLDNFQISFDLLKQGHLRAAYTFIWEAHYLVLSVLGGILFGMVAGGIGGIFRRRRWMQMYFPNRKGPGSKEPGSDTDSD